MLIVGAQKSKEQKHAVMRQILFYLKKIIFPKRQQTKYSTFAAPNTLTWFDG